MSKLMSIVGQLLADHQKNVDQAMRALHKIEGFSSSSIFKDGFSNTSYQIQRDDKSLTINTTANNAAFSLRVSLPISADSEVQVTTTDKEGKSETKSIKFSEYLKGFEVPEELKEICSKVSKYLNTLFPNLLKELGAQSCGESSETCCGPEVQKASEPNETSQLPKDVDTSQEFKEYVLQREGDLDVKFTGKILLATRSQAVNGRFKEYILFETKGGKYIAQTIGHSLWPNEVKKSTVNICSDKKAVIDHFGKGYVGSYIADTLGWRNEAYTEYVE